MNRRQFLYKSFSVSVLALGSGYASMNKGPWAYPQWTESQGEKARKAAEIALRGSPEADEGLIYGRRDTQFIEKEEREKPDARRIAREDTPDAIDSTESLAQDTDASGLHPGGAGESSAHGSAGPDIARQPHMDVPSDSEAPVRIEVISEAEPAPVEESDVVSVAPETLAESTDEDERFRQRIQHFDYDFSDDVHISEAEYTILISVLERLNRVEAYVGHGNFNVLAFDDMLKYGRAQPRIGAFTGVELEYMEKLFYDDVRRLGFFGDRVINSLEHKIGARDINKIPYSGHFLFRGQAEDYYNKVRGQVGESLILTSGIRGIVKQYHLFMARVVRAEGNLSRASRSLAPPGHSYHALGDFDVGVVGGGLANFTAAFAETDEYKRLLDLGFVEIRYTEDNRYGVRFEPWHIRVA